MTRHSFIRSLASSFLLIIIASFAYSQEYNVKNDYSAKTENQYHLGWVWPDSIPILTSKMAVGPDGKIYVVGEDCTLYCVQDDGEILWAFYGGYQAISTPILTSEMIIICAANGDRGIHYNELVAIDYAGKFLWNFDGPNGLEPDPIVMYKNYMMIQSGEKYRNIDGVFRISRSGKSNYIQWPDNISYGALIGCDTLGNMLVWQRGNDRLFLISQERKIIKDCLSEGEPFLGVNSSRGARIVFHSVRSDIITAFDLNCSEIWEYIDDEQQGYVSPISGLVLNQNQTIVYVATYNEINNGSIYTFDVKTGKLIWKVDLDKEIGEVRDLVLTENGSLIVSTSNAILIEINNSGKQIWRHKMYKSGFPCSLSLNQKNELLLVQEGKLLRFTTESSKIIFEGDPAPTPKDKHAVESEIIPVILEDITDSFNYLFNLIKSEPDSKKVPPIRPSPSSLIIYSILMGIDDKAVSINTAKPNMVWQYEKGQLIKENKPKEALENYNKNKGDGFMPWGYNIYKFGIMSISQDFQEAEVYLNHYCGRLCGTGDRMILHRSPSGKWWIISREQRWIS